VVIVTGSVVVREEAVEEALEVALTHVRPSRTEPGCLLHSVHRDAEQSNRLFFFEQWSDRAALDTHFGVPGSAELVRALSALAVEPPSMQIYDVPS
jgi:quinol monooxygenase YgiN